jgi:O-antigen/teichoic acid export membrane protein
MRSFINKISAFFLRLNEGSTLRRNFFLLARANIFSLALPILAMPVLARIYQPSAFATLGLFMAAVAILSSFSTWRLDWVMPNSRSDVMSASLFVAGVAFLAILIVLFLVGVTIFSLYFSDLSAATGLGWTLWLAVPILVAIGLRALLHGWLVRTGELDAVARSTVVQSSTNVVISLAAGIAGLVSIGLILGATASSWAGIGMLVVRAGKRLSIALSRVKKRSIVTALKKYGKQATWSTLASILNSISLHAPVLMLGALYPSQEVGWFVLMHRMIATPLGTFSTALGNSFWSNAASLARRRDMLELSRVYHTVTRRLVLASLPIVVICLSGPLFVGPLLGEKDWSGAGAVLAAMTPLFVGGLLFSPTNHLAVLGKQELQLLVGGLRLGLVGLGITAAYALDLGFVAAVAFLSSGSFLGYLAIHLIQIREHAK